MSLGSNYSGGFINFEQLSSHYIMPTILLKLWFDLFQVDVIEVAFVAYCVTFLTTALNKSIKEKEVPWSDFSTHQHVSNNDLDRTISIGPSDPEHDQSYS